MNPNSLDLITAIGRLAKTLNVLINENFYLKYRLEVVWTCHTYAAIYIFWYNAAWEMLAWEMLAAKA